MKPFQYDIPSDLRRQHGPTRLTIAPLTLEQLEQLRPATDLESRASTLAAAVLDWDYHDLGGTPVPPSIEVFRDFLAPGGFQGLLRWSPDLTARLLYELRRRAVHPRVEKRKAGRPIRRDDPKAIALWEEMERVKAENPTLKDPELAEKLNLPDPRILRRYRDAFGDQ
jgi:hypothetical protein